MPTALDANRKLTKLQRLNHDYIRPVQTSDVRRFDGILAENFYCGPDSLLVDRKAFLEQTARPVTTSSLEAHDVLIRVFGDAATDTLPDGRARLGRYTDDWLRRDGHWLAVSAHVTRS